MVTQLKWTEYCNDLHYFQLKIDLTVLQTTTSGLTDLPDIEKVGRAVHSLKGGKSPDVNNVLSCSSMARKKQ